MAYPYIDTPRTEIDGNATYLTTGYRSVGRHNLSALDSVENSFQTPSKDEDVLKVLGEGRRRSSGSSKLNTPRAAVGPKSTRSALNSRQLPSASRPKGEFTPMMMSAVKNNHLKNLTSTRGLGGPKTPAYLRQSYRSTANTPGLPVMEMTGIDEEDATLEDPTPLPQVASSSVQGTPIPGLSRRDGGGILNDGNNMTLKEQEKIIDKLDKDNFGLKLKIHFLQEQLEKAGPSYNHAALMENTELKVSKLTMQRDISRYKKSLHQAERDLESYRQQFEELREKMQRRQTDETIQREMDLMREEVDSREQRVRDLQEQLRDSKDSQSQEIEKLRDEIEDLEASLREKDRVIDQREEEIEELKDKDGQENDALTELESELQRAKEQLEELQDSLDQAKSEAREARDAEEQAVKDKEAAEENLQELHDEMANKSFSTRGLTRQLEEKASKVEEELRELRQENNALKEELEQKSRTETSLEEQSQKAQRTMGDEKQKLLEELSKARRECELAHQERDKVSASLREALDEVQRKSEEKDMLHTRHHALTDESGTLQHELTRAQSKIRELQQTVDLEKQHALEDAETVRSQYLEDIERLQEEIEALHHEIEDKEGQFALEQDRWESAKRNLQLQKDRAEDQAAGFKRTIEKLEQVEHTLTGKESKLQEVIDSEKARHFNAEAVLSRQVKELNDDLTSKRDVIDQLRGELLSAKEELRLTRRAESALKDKVQALEDEIVVLQSSLEEEQQYMKGRVQEGSSDQENQLQKLVAEKQKLRDQLANAHVELHDLKSMKTEVEGERDELQAQLDQIQKQVEDTAKFDKEKVELRKSSLRMESELKRLKEDKFSLLEAKDSLENQLGTEIERAALEENRLSAEIEKLQDKLHVASGGKDRELALAKSKLQRFEQRTLELEALLEHQIGETEHSGAAADLSILRHNLDEVRKREKALIQREADQKSSIRTYKLRIVELERELHDALMIRYESHSPSSSPSSKLHEDLRAMRKQLSDAHRALKDLKLKNQELERAAMREEDQRDLHELLKQSTLEAESLALKVSEREAQVNETKSQIRRIREERALHAKKADTALKELEALQNRYKHAVEKAGARSDSKIKHDKEILGLGKEIIWLRARLKREEKFRRDLAWSKGLMELGERVRVACNEADLRMISDMGVKPRGRTRTRSPHAKLKTAVSMVKAVVRMQRMGREWTKAKKLGEGLKRAKNEVMKRRESSLKTRG